MFYIRHDGNVAIACFLPRDSRAAEYGGVSDGTIQLDDHRDPVAPRPDHGARHPQITVIPVNAMSAKSPFTYRPLDPAVGAGWAGLSGLETPAHRRVRPQAAKKPEDRPRSSVTTLWLQEARD